MTLAVISFRQISELLFFSRIRGIGRSMNAR
jgi:hypothetical protein